MLDPPLKFAKEEIDDNAGADRTCWPAGASPSDKDLVLDTSGVGQIFGLGPEFPLVTSYESHAIVRDDEGDADGLPDRAVARSEERRSDDGRETVLDHRQQLRHRRIWLRPRSSNRTNDKKGPLVLGAAGTYNGKGDGKGRFVVVGSSSWCSNSFLRFNGNRDLFLNMYNWLSFGRRSDFDPAQGTRRTAA